jgi:hypothetical protein
MLPAPARWVVVCLVVLALVPSNAQAQAGVVRWRDLAVQLPPDWRRLTTDPDSAFKMGSSRFRSSRRISRGSDSGSYRFAVDPSDGTARLSRVKPDGDLEQLADWTDAPLFNLGSGSNHIEVLCRGSLIELRINQAPVISVHDTQVTEGSMSFGAGSFPDSDVVAEFRFANFVLTQR